MSKQIFKITAILLSLLTSSLQPCTTEDVSASVCGDSVGDDEDYLDMAMHPAMLDKTTSENSVRVNREINKESTIAYWLQKGKEFVRKQASEKFNKGKAKNIILFVGDGMGLTTFAAARNLLGGEEMQLSFEKFPYTGLSKTYALDTMVPDSACAATALLCGVKGNRGTIGFNGYVERRSCAAMRNTSNQVDSIAKWALDAGKAAGLVTTSRVTHDTPAGVYAHAADSAWENDVILAADCSPDADIDDIAQQLIRGKVGRNLKVILGGGKREFVDSRYYKYGVREDDGDLIADYLQQSYRNAYVQTREQLMQLSLNAHDRLLGLFHKSHFDYNLMADELQPSLKDMTVRAIEMLQNNNKNGFFLFVESGLIDMAHHKNLAEFALDETVELAKAVEAARDMTSEDDTLIVVTADHSHTFSISGYQDRGSDIFNVTPNKATDKEPFMALSYANGPGFDYYYNFKKHKRLNVETVHSLYDIYPATVPMESATHSGEDVAVFASGPWSHLFTGVYEQNAIPHFMAYAACLGDGLKAC